MSINNLEDSPSHDVDKIDKDIPTISESVVFQTEPTENIENNALTNTQSSSDIPKNIQMKKIVTIFLICVCMLAFFVYSKWTEKSAPIFDFPQGQIEFNITISRKYSWIKQKLDHSNQNSSIWKQRLFIKPSNSKFDEFSPIFLYISDLSPLSQQQKSPFLVTQSEEKGGMLIGLQTRYFGQSLPFGPDSHSINNLQYLTMEQMVEDIKNVITRIKQNSLFGVTSYNPWIINGAWIAGTVVAWFRAKYPDLTIGAFVSSPVSPTLFVQKVNQRSYSNINSGGRKCRSIIQKIMNQLESDIYSDKQQSMLNKHGEGLPITPEDVLYMIEDKLRDLPRFFCIQNSNNNQDQIKQFLTKFLLENYYYVDPIRFSQIEMNIEREWKQYQILRTSRSKSFLRCNQLGLFQTGDPQKTYISKMINQTYFRNKCKAIFGVQIWPNPDALKQRIDDSIEMANNLLIVHGYYDIWLPYGLTPSNNSEAYLDVVKCSICQRVPDYYKKQITKEIDKVLQLQTQMIDQWLEQFYSSIR